jgi:retron-type reverse transcriptase
LAGRLKRKKYRARLVRRKWIPKGNTGKLRPLGIPVLEDKLLQVAVTQILLERVLKTSIFYYNVIVQGLAFL